MNTECNKLANDKQAIKSIVAVHCRHILFVDSHAVLF